MECRWEKICYAAAPRKALYSGTDPANQPNQMLELAKGFEPPTL
jgi:hypothetical protein